MGGDGGTCCTRRDIVTKTYKEPGKQDREYEVNALWTFCSISGNQLKKPIGNGHISNLFFTQIYFEFLVFIFDKS